MPPDSPAEPWHSFLTDLDEALRSPIDLHCFGGFAVSQHYGFARETADLDVLSVSPPSAAQKIMALAGRQSPLHRKHRVYIDHVAVSNYPDDYETRIRRIFPIWKCVRLWVLEPHDLALTKLERSNDRDIRDVIYLAQSHLITKETLVSRFESELAPYLSGPTPDWHRSTLRMWLDACWPAS
ncbi:MAG: DUF6036 family nucleotidyltransferase [Bryobacter sp.]|nr:DUF6036 family nucleotidyltransferase [Bryobacter sp.]